MATLFKNLDSSQACQLLSRLTFSLSPSPESKVESFVGEISEAETLQQIRHELELKETDESEQAKSRIFGFITDEMCKRILHSADQNKIKGRLALKGILPAKDYGIHFTDAFKAGTERYGFHNQQIEDVLRSPDLRQNMPVESEYLPPDSKYLLSVKTFGRFHSPNRYSLLVESKCDSATHDVINAWKIYHSEVSCESCQEPWQLLNAFIEKYGVTIQFRESSPTKLIENEVIQLNEKIVSDHEMFEKIHSLIAIETTPSVGTGFIRQNNLNMLVIRYFFVIDLAKYEYDLRKHGNKIPLPRKQR